MSQRCQRGGVYRARLSRALGTKQATARARRHLRVDFAQARALGTTKGTAAPRADLSGSGSGAAPECAGAAPPQSPVDPSEEEAELPRCGAANRLRSPTGWGT